VSGYYGYEKLDTRGEESAWARAKNSFDFEEYLANYPNGLYVEEAKKMIEKEEWELAKSKGTLFHLNKFERTATLREFQEKAAAEIDRINKLTVFEECCDALQKLTLSEIHPITN
jgi:hypothetical protein